MNIAERKSSRQLLAAAPGQLNRLFMELLHSRGGQEWFARAMLTDERLLLAVLKLAAEDDTGQAALPALDVKMLQFIDSMSTEEQRRYAETGELPARPARR